jgi:hypothetical protein
MLSVCIVSATRHDEAGFYGQSALGRSLKRAYRLFPVKPKIAFRNSKPLAVCYNAALASCEPNDIVVFIHDDILLVDLFWIDRLESGFRHFDVLGIIGNTRRLPRQASWCWLDDEFTWDDKRFLSGVIAIGQDFPSCDTAMFGVTGQRCKLLDGVLLAAKAYTPKRAASASTSSSRSTSMTWIGADRLNALGYAWGPSRCPSFTRARRARTHQNGGRPISATCQSGKSRLSRPSRLSGRMRCSRRRCRRPSPPPYEPTNHSTRCSAVKISRIKPMTVAKLIATAGSSPNKLRRYLKKVPPFTQNSDYQRS